MIKIINPLFSSTAQTGGLGASDILGELDQKDYTEKLLSYLDPVIQSPDLSRFVRCWHAKTDGSLASTFHSNCDEKGPTVTIIKVNSYIFGGYTDVSWYSGKQKTKINTTTAIVASTE